MALLVIFSLLLVVGTVFTALRAFPFRGGLAIWNLESGRLLGLAIEFASAQG